MSLNLECLRDVLLMMAREDMGDKWIFCKGSDLLETYSAKEVIRHVKLCHKIGYVNDYRAYFGSCLEAFGLTERGKTFTEKINDNTYWSWLVEQYNKFPPFG
ncbi:MAG TPA: hypothetical protein DEB31_00515 [Clostridiales bacterium]|nr:hypothetical protein [Clostridiales bacterium]